MKGALIEIVARMAGTLAPVTLRMASVDDTPGTGALPGPSWYQMEDGDSALLLLTEPPHLRITYDRDAAAIAKDRECGV